MRENRAAPIEKRLLWINSSCEEAGSDKEIQMLGFNGVIVKQASLHRWIDTPLSLYVELDSKDRFSLDDKRIEGALIQSDDYGRESFSGEKEELLSEDLLLEEMAYFHSLFQGGKKILWLPPERKWGRRVWCDAPKSIHFPYRGPFVEPQMLPRFAFFVMEEALFSIPPLEMAFTEDEVTALVVKASSIPKRGTLYFEALFSLGWGMATQVSPMVLFTKAVQARYGIESLRSIVEMAYMEREIHECFLFSEKQRDENICDTVELWCKRIALFQEGQKSSLVNDVGLPFLFKVAQELEAICLRERIAPKSLALIRS